MARYYFDILDGAQNVRDDEGSGFGSLDAAVQAAARSAAGIGTGRLARGIPAMWLLECGTSAASESAPSEHRWRSSGTSHGHWGRSPGAHRCMALHAKKEPGTGPGSLEDGHEHQHVCSSMLTPMVPFQNCRAGG